jgi:hypothetical protein
LGELGLMFCLGVLGLQMAIHLGTWVPGNNISQMTALLAFVPTFLSFAMLFLVEDNPLLRPRTKSSKRERTPSATARQIAMWVVLPLWFRRILAILGIYLAVTFVAAVFALWHGGPELRARVYLAGNHKLGIPYRQITEAEYWRLEAHSVRVLASLGVMISLLPVVAFVWDRSRSGRKPD